MLTRRRGKIWLDFARRIFFSKVEVEVVSPSIKGEAVPLQAWTRR
jgi:hypothetical protein